MWWGNGCVVCLDARHYSDLVPGADMCMRRLQARQSGAYICRPWLIEPILARNGGAWLLQIATLVGGSLELDGGVSRGAFSARVALRQHLAQLIWRRWVEGGEEVERVLVFRANTSHRQDLWEKRERCALSCQTAYLL
jgi:hypothetical protein